ncbi:MAG: polysaccharide biosynthesis tyrosine autokinase [Cyanobacteria bacterium J06623_7]
MSQIEKVSPSERVAWEAESQSELGYGQLFSTLWQRRFWFAGVFGSVLAIAIPLSLMKKPIYLSQMQVLPESNYRAKQIRNNGTDNQYLESQFTDNSVEIDYATQLKVLKSSEILKRVMDKLGWETSATERVEIIEALREAIVVSQIADLDAESNAVQTKIIQTVYYDQDPVRSKQVLEAIRDVYLEYNLEQQEKRLKDGLTFINKQIPQAQQDLSKAEASVTALSKKYNVVDPAQEAIALKENIRNIALEREALVAQKSEISGNYQTLQQQLGLSTESSVALSRLSQSNRYQNLLNELQAIELELAAKRTQHQDNSPIILGLVEQKDSQKALLRNESLRILGSLPPNFDAELESMLRQGQLVTSDTQFVSEMTQAQADLAGIDQRTAALKVTEAKLRERLTQFPELISRYKDLTQEAQVRREALQRLREAKQELEIELNRGGFNWQVIEPPQLGQQIGPNLKKDLLLSVVVASFLGVSTAFVREAIDERISNVKEVERQTALPLLGSTPGLTLPSSSMFVGKLPFFAGTHTTSQSAEVIQWQPFREALDVVYENLRLSGLSSSLRSLAITSATAGEGKSTLTLGLALSVARHQQRVLVIDADLRRPGLHESFSLPNQTGLTDYLAGEIDQPDIEQVFLQGEYIDLITSGAKTNDPVKLLSSSRLQNLIEQYEADYDLIIVDTPSAIGMVDAVKIASICDSALLMMRLNQVKSSELLEAEALLSKLNVLGIVANDSQEYEDNTAYLLPQFA